MISLLSPALGARIYVDPARSRQMGPRMFRPGPESVARILAAAGDLRTKDAEILTHIVRVSLELGGGYGNDWLGVCESLLPGTLREIMRLVTLGVVDLESGLGSPNGIDTDRVYFPSRSLIRTVVQQLPPGP